MKYSKIWKKLLIIWIALGIAVSGYFHIFPIVEKRIVHYDDETFEKAFGPKIIREPLPIDKVSFLIMIVGGVLIGGFGKLSANNIELSSKSTTADNKKD